MPRAPRARGLKVIIAGAGGAAHLPGMTASMTTLPVLGVPVESKALKGQDSLYSIVQMPAGVPVGTLAIGEAGAKNAGLLAAANPGAVRRRPRRPARSLAHSSIPPTSPKRPCKDDQAAMTALPPGSTIGILGGGQLGRMLAMAAARLGLKSHIYAPEADSPAFDVAAAHTIAAYEDEAQLAAFAKCGRRRDLRIRKHPGHNGRILVEARIPVRPGAKALACAQDRMNEKTLARELGAMTAEFAADR